MWQAASQPLPLTPGLLPATTTHRRSDSVTCDKRRVSCFESPKDMVVILLSPLSVSAAAFAYPASQLAAPGPASAPVSR